MIFIWNSQKHFYFLLSFVNVHVKPYPHDLFDKNWNILTVTEEILIELCMLKCKWQRSLILLIIF